MAKREGARNVKMISGQTLRRGEVVKKGDQRDLGFGFEPVQEPIIGHSIQPGQAGVFIRATGGAFPRKKRIPE